MARFESLEQLLDAVGLNARALEALAKAGALESVLGDMNELEAAQYARDYLAYRRERDAYKEKLKKWELTCQEREQKFRQQVEERRQKMQRAEAAYQEKLEAYHRRLAEVRKKNRDRAAEGKKLLKEPPQPKPPRQLKEPVYSAPPPMPKAPSPPPKPRIALSHRERVKLQREMLNVYLTGHPLDELHSLPEEAAPISEVKKLGKDEVCTIVGVQLSHKVTNTRKKQLMARSRLEDRSGSVEVVIFPSLYAKLKGQLEDGRIYRVLGRTQLSEGEAGSCLTIIAMEMEEAAVGSDKEWDILYPLLIGSFRVLPGRTQKSRSLAESILWGTAYGRENVVAS